MNNIIVFESNERRELFIQVPIDYSNLNIGDEIKYTLTEEQKKEIESFYPWEELSGKIGSKKVDISNGVIYWHISVICLSKYVSCIDCKFISVNKYSNPCYGCYDNGEHTNFVKSENIR